MGIQPKVCIIIVNYNGYIDTIDCLRSLRAITYSNYEVVIVDNASPNDSVDRIRDYALPKEILLQSEVNGGFSAGNNIGIRYAMEHYADYCLLLNNDTVVEGNFLDELIKTAEEYKRKAVVTSKINYYYDKTKIWYAGGTFSRLTSRTTHIGINETDNGQHDQRKEVSFISGCCMLLPIDVISDVGMMDEKFFLYCEDLAYCCEIVEGGYSLIYEPKAVIYHKVNSSTGKSSDMVTFYTVRNKLYIVDKYFAGFKKITAYSYHVLEIIKRMLTREYKTKSVFEAINSFCIGAIESKEK